MTKRMMLVFFSILFIFSTTIAYGGAVDVTDQVLTDMLEKVSEHKDKNTMIDILEIGLTDSNSIDGLKTVLANKMDPAKEQALAEKGITKGDLEKSIDSLKDWTPEARDKLIGYLKSNDMDKVKDLVQNDGILEEDATKEENQEGNVGGGGVTKTPDTPEKENSKEQLPIEEKTPEKVKHHFKDIEMHWAKTSIENMASLGIVSGIDENNFAPELQVTRSQMVTFIVKLLNMDTTVKANMPFADVANDAWYHDFIKAAYHAKLINGTSPDTFDPNASVTREQMMVMVINALKFKNMLTEEGNQTNLEKFQDQNKLSSWAVEAMHIAVEKGLIKGRTENTLAPDGVATRAEAITIINKVYQLINN
ncbi:S-layer homology domain-containing protein [Clostridiaceae bacterium 35-E11]